MALLAGKDTGRRRLYVQRMSEAFAERTQQITFVTSEKCVREREREKYPVIGVQRGGGGKKVRIEGRRHSATSEIANKRPFHQP